MAGQVGILNVGAGDTKLVFDPSNPADCIRAARVVKDMIRRGYALLVDTGKRDAGDRPIYARAKDFDETKFEYIIADFDPLIAAEEDANAEDESTAAQSDGAPGEKAKVRKPRSVRKAIPAESVNAIAVARTAGG
ncbi:MAG TPA: hypothetical protein VIF40_17815 [Methylosinus sp.]|jgi:hypothetical protein|uniref:hypothetical protein n=1 Tax=Methylosinus sp. TaxID=427 RepID=UPI002F94F635